MKTKLKYSLRLLGFIAFSQATHASNNNQVILKDASYKVVEAGPNLSGTDGCTINGFGSKIEQDIKADPLTNKISLKYNPHKAEIDTNSYNFYLTNKAGKKLYSANRYTEGLLLAPYRFIEITGKNSESKNEIMINQHKYVVSDIWFSSVCINQQTCKDYVYTAIGFINPDSKQPAICYIYNSPYGADDKGVKSKIDKNRTLSRKKSLSEEM